MVKKDKYKLLFTKLDEAVEDQKKKFNNQFEYCPVQDESIKQLIEICHLIEEDTPPQEYNSFTTT